MIASPFAVLLCATVLASAKGGQTLWPAADAALLPSGDAEVTPGPDGAVVRTGISSRWPGARLSFRGEERDLSPFSTLTIVVSNRTDHALSVGVSVKDHWHHQESPGISKTLPARTEDEIVVFLADAPWTLDAPLEFHGMNGFPKADPGAQRFDLRRVQEIHVFLGDQKSPQAYAIRQVSVGGQGGTPGRSLSAAGFMPFVDRYGQFAHGDWPGKIHGDEDLKAAREREEKWFETHPDAPAPEIDKYGGWTAGPSLKATGFFRTEKANGKWWLVDPDGHLFFSHGIDCVQMESFTPVTRRETYFSELPDETAPGHGDLWRTGNSAPFGFYAAASNRPYKTFSFARWNALRSDGPGWKERYIDRTHRRLRAWGFNTIANWSDPAVYERRRTPYAVSLVTDGTPRLKNSKGWWAPLPDPFAPEFASVLRKRAKDLAKSIKDDPWCIGVFVDNELSWYEKPEGLERIAEKYYEVVATVVHEELPNHLYLGSRFSEGTPDIWQAAARHCDVVSVNVYRRNPRLSLPDGVADKPMIVGEFHFGALDRGLFHAGLVPTANQSDRAREYRDYMHVCLDNPRVVGAHWFQWRDQALTGRFDGENFQIGFVNVTDVPYAEMVDAARSVAGDMYPRRFGRPRADAPTRIIFDTDMFDDYDDVGALALLHKLADRGEAEILATTSCTRGNSSVAMIEVVNSHYGRPEIPVGCVRDVGLVGRGTGWSANRHRVFEEIAGKYAAAVRHPDSSSAPDALGIWRRALADAPDGSVTICTVGSSSNVRRLLESGPDETSPLSGLDLARRKAIRWVAMAGWYPKGKETNVRIDAESAERAFRTWPNEIIFSDFQYGHGVYCGRAVAESTATNSPVKDVFARLLPTREAVRAGKTGYASEGGHFSWDETTVLAAVRGLGKTFGLERGRYQVVSGDGTAEWDAQTGSGGRLTERMPRREVGALMDALIAEPPRHTAR